ncbi:MAG: hypothetical protein IJJ25_07930 [Lachnospiraceae bacterium]|nr:hypothetical protein [Lachnospiraceae bacterium]
MNKILPFAFLLTAVLLPCRVSAAVNIKQTYADCSRVRIEVSGTPADAAIRISTSPYGIYADWKEKTRTLSASEYELKGLYEGSRYYVRLGNSRPVSVVTAPKGSIKSAVQTGSGRNYVTVSWEKVPHADAYRISGADAAGHIFNEHLTASEYGRIKLPREDERYRICIIPVKKTAKYCADGSRFESGLTFRTLPAKLKAPEYKKNRLGNGSAYFSWDVSPAAAGYEYEISDSSGKKIFAGTSIRNTAWIGDSRLKDGAFYGIRVRGTVALAEGTAAGPWSGRTYFCGNVRTVKLKRNGRRIKIRWKGVKGAESYRIYVSEKAPDRLSGMKCVKTVKKAHFTLKRYGGKALKIGKTYYISVAAVKRTGGKTFVSRPSRYYYLS